MRARSPGTAHFVRNSTGCNHRIAMSNVYNLAGRVSCERVFAEEPYLPPLTKIYVVSRCILLLLISRRSCMCVRVCVCDIPRKSVLL